MVTALEFHETRKVIRIIITTILVFTTCVNVGLVIYCSLKCYRVFREYKTCQTSPNLHPIYKDVQYLSQQRKLYNLKTHLVKYVLMVMCLCTEIVATVWTGITLVIGSELTKYANDNPTMPRSLELAPYPNCTVHYFFRISYTFPYFIPILQLNTSLYILLFVLLSILIRYLAARYLNHPFQRTLLKYLIWLALQLLLFALCSTLYSFLFSVVLSPIFGIANWLVLSRDYLILLRVLRSNLREIRLHYNNKVLYREQLYAYKSYHLFGRILVFSLFWLVIADICLCIKCIYQLIFDSYCVLDLIYNLNFSVNMANRQENTSSTVEHYALLLNTLVFFMYILTNSIPSISITVLPIVGACIKRYRSRHYVYRYNYANTRIKPLLRKS